MATVTIHGRRLLVTTTVAERGLGLVHDLDVPLGSIRSASPVTSWREAHGLRVGTSFPGIWLAGSWYSPGCRQLVLLRRGVPALHLVLDGQRYDEVVVSTPDAVALLRRLHHPSAGPWLTSVPVADRFDTCEREGA